MSRNLFEPTSNYSREWPMHRVRFIGADGKELYMLGTRAPNAADAMRRAVAMSGNVDTGKWAKAVVHENDTIGGGR